MKKIFLLIVFMFSAVLSAQTAKITFSGTVLNSIDKTPVEFASIVILETKSRAFSDRYGKFKIEISEPGEYTVIVNSDGLKYIQKKIKVTSDYNETFLLEPLSISGSALTITAKKEKQTISRRTMTQEDMKETPASFGDSISALTSLPGVERTDGFFGPLQIRGADASFNRYYIDGMPIDNPMHMLGLHSVISNDLMEEIDLYSSSFPVNFGDANAAIININTIDTVDKFSGVVDISLLSSALLLKMPIKKYEMVDGEMQKVNTGYTILSGRIGYLSLILPRLAELFGNESPFVADYGDYQIKTKYYFNKKHAVRLLAIGAKDKTAVNTESLVDVEEGDDPLMTDLQMSNDTSFNNIGLYYDYKSGKITNTLFSFVSVSNNRTFLYSGSADAPQWLKDFEINNTPYIVSVKDDLSFEWWKNISSLDIGLGYTYYYFTVDGKSLVVDNYSEPFNPYDDISTRDYSKNVANQIVNGYADNRIKIGGLKLNTGVRSDYLKRTGQATFDPRIMTSYTFASDTTVSYAGGRYSSFFQVNPMIFQSMPYLSEASDDVEPTVAYHNALGVEQLYKLLTFSVEGYYNIFTNEPVYFSREVDGVMRYGETTGRAVTYGTEIMIRKDRQEKSNGVFGWMSYTYNISRYKSGISDPLYADAYWDKYKTSDAQRDHALKLVAGYRLGKHTFSGRFQLLSGDYYTPIVGSEKQTLLPSGTIRYGEEYSTDINSKQLPFNHRLDLRYSYLSSYSWGNVKWYIEVIDAYGLFVERELFEDWKYNEPYSDSNPSMYKEKGFPIPNFGVEIKF
ncbi:MAG: TonB-dependent receptor [Spirochaetes bacterium]|nr:TonB-dependent receptor [Spirochaetota bacterium]